MIVTMLEWMEKAHETPTFHKELQATGVLRATETVFAEKSSPVGYPAQTCLKTCIQPLYTHMQVTATNENKEAMDLKESKDRYMGGFQWRKGTGVGEGEMTRL